MGEVWDARGGEVVRGVRGLFTFGGGGKGGKGWRVKAKMDMERGMRIETTSLVILFVGEAGRQVGFVEKMMV